MTKKWFLPGLFTVIIPFALNCYGQKQKQGEPVDYLFVLFDAGETHAMLPVLSKLEQTGQSFAVILFGTSRRIRTLEGMTGKALVDGADLTGIPVDNRWERHQPLPKDALNTVVQAYQPKVLVTGASAELQRQFVQAYRLISRTVAYFDNYGPIDNISYASIVRKIEGLVDKLMVPSTSVAKTASRSNAVVVGQPALEATLEDSAKIDNAAVFRKTGLDSNVAVVSFFGGYDPEYQTVLTTFVQGVKVFPELQVVIRPHPKSDGIIEKEVIKHEACSNCRLSTNNMTTQEAMKISDVVVCHHSTLGIQAVFLGKPVIYVEVPVSTFTNPDLSEWRLSPQVTNVTDFQAALKDARQKKTMKQAALFELSGIPENGADRIIKVLREQLKVSGIEKTDPVNR